MSSSEENYCAEFIFPTVQEVINKPNYVDVNERYQYQYPIIMRYLKNKIRGWGIGDFFEKNRVKKIVLYAVTEFTELVCDDLKNGDAFAELTYICDKNYMKFSEGYKGHQVVGIEKLLEDYEADEIEQIVVCSIFHANEIFEELLQRGIRLDDLVSINNIIFGAL